MWAGMVLTIEERPQDLAAPPIWNQDAYRVSSVALFSALASGQFLLESSPLSRINHAGVVSL